MDCVVPKILNLTKAQARKLLEENGLLLNEKVTYIESKTVEAGLVVEQSIAPDEKVPPKTKISIILASEHSGEKDNDNEKPASQIVEKTFHYSTEALDSPTVVKIIEKSSEGRTQTIFEQQVDPATLDEIVVKVKGKGSF